MALADEIVGQPGDQEIADVVIGEKAGTSAPSGAELEELEQRRGAGRLRRVRGLVQLGLGCKCEPREQPEKAGRAENDEERPPADPGDQQAAEKEAETGAEEKS